VVHRRRDRKAHDDHCGNVALNRVQLSFSRELPNSAAATLSGFSVATAFAFHANFADPNQIAHFLKNLAISGGLLHVVVVGSGRYAVDVRRPVCTSRPDATASPSSLRWSHQETHPDIDHDDISVSGPVDETVTRGPVGRRPEYIFRQNSGEST
jgi:hypothetical protein